MVKRIVLCIEDETEKELTKYFSKKFPGCSFVTKVSENVLYQTLTRATFDVAILQQDLMNFTFHDKKMEAYQGKHIYLIDPSLPSYQTPIIVLKSITDIRSLIDNALPTSSLKSRQHKNQPVKSPINKIATNEDQETFIEPLTSYWERGLGVRKEAFTKATWERNKTIGIWSPLEGKGVTTFTVNLALFLAQYKVPTAVLEGISEKRKLRLRIQRFTEQPAEWASYARALFDETVLPDQPKWLSNGVSWIPLQDDECNYKWDYDALNAYVNPIKVYDILLIDLPTGKMNGHTTTLLEFIDELWIVCDHSYPELLEWKSYISEMKQKGVPMKLIFPYTLPFSENEKIAEQLGIEILAEMPPFDIKTGQKNLLQKKLLIQQPEFKSMEKGFIAIKDYLNLSQYDRKNTFINRFKRIFSNSLVAKRH